MFLLSMALVEGLIKALKSVTLYQCRGCVGCAPADLAVVQIQSGLHSLSLCPCDSRITQKCLWITSILLTEFGGIWNWAAASRMHSRGQTLPVFGSGRYSEPWRRWGWERCMGTTRVNTKIDSVAKIKERSKTKRCSGGWRFSWCQGDVQGGFRWQNQDPLHMIICGWLALCPISEGTWSFSELV